MKKTFTFKKELDDLFENIMYQVGETGLIGEGWGGGIRFYDWHDGCVYEIDDNEVADLFCEVEDGDEVTIEVEAEPITTDDIETLIREGDYDFPDDFHLVPDAPFYKQTEDAIDEYKDRVRRHAL